MGPGGGFRDREKMQEKLKEPKPQSIKEVPAYVCRIVTKFFQRLFYIFKLVWETKPWILLFMIFMALWNGVSPVISQYIGALLLNALQDAYISITTGGENLFDNVVKLLIFQFAFNFASSTISRVGNIINNISSELVINHINLKIMYKAKEVDLASFDDPEFYARFENAKREASIRPLHILNNNFNIVSTVISMVGYLAILWNVAPLFPIIIIVFSIPTAVINFAYRKKSFWYMRYHSKERRQMNYYSEVMTNKDMVKEVRMFNLHNTFIGRYQDTFKVYFKGLRKLFVGEGLWNIGVNLVGTTVNCILFVLIARGVADGSYKIGDYQLYIGALMSIAGCVGTLISSTGSIYEGTLFIDNLIKFINEKRHIVSSLASPRKVAHHTGHRIEFRHVSFAYPGTERNVLNDVNFVLEPGDTCVLVGLNGAGKTTLIKLLTRLYDPAEGEIFLDGYNIKDYDTDDLYSLFGIIFQDFGKYAVSVSENIKFGDIERNGTHDDVVEAAEQSTADQFIENLPGKYNTPLMRYFEDDGIELSIGQWQKLSIARAFYSDSDIMILDEPTASLDAIAEQEIYNQFDRLRKDKTTIFVSHRLSSATVANKIIVINNGTLEEMGDHAELMKKHGTYYDLFTTQAKRYITPIDGMSAEQFMMGSEESEKLHSEGHKPPMPPHGAGRPPMPR